jgi:hypothetical protein
MSFILGLNRGKFIASHHSPFTTGQRVPDTFWIKDWEGLKTEMEEDCNGYSSALLGMKSDHLEST